ncbi:MAG: hypothetical protein A2Y17_08390 [Clostridiales bacterium GWF2_38_85]|nr:MAG: hypothetical protein A2Y17_08390 [Clostridiales bacterium GWF2_38_85]HBL83789.1 MBL fold metallo-hydrolase [Clostridiales bacterium]
MIDVEAYTLFSGSSGNATYIKSGHDEFLIDAGVSCRAINEALGRLGSSLSKIRAIFITHEHTDHIKGLETISKKYKIPVFITSVSAKTLSNYNCYVGGCIINNEIGDKVYLDDTVIETNETPHDSLSCTCFRITLANGTKLGYATDIGKLSQSVKENLLGCDYIVIESNHDVQMLKCGAYPYYLKQRILSDRGHLSNKNCATYLPSLVEAGAKCIVLAHLSRDNNRPDIAFSESRLSLNTAGIRVAMKDVDGDITLRIAQPCEPVKIIY